MNMNAYKFGFFVPGRTSYYSPYETSVVNAEDQPTATDTWFEGDEDVGVHAIPEES
ncbi:hypothetical protein NC651_019981 [Populus alba x Populus x berolinensis]|nr:hypothetical protein NC651_019981 [Populus alba x Populus x berolinensis]